MKARIFIITLISVLYGAAIYFIFNPQAYEYYIDYYIFNNRTFSRSKEQNFLQKTPAKPIEIFKTYTFNQEHSQILTLGFDAPKSEGRWSLGNKAFISFAVPKINADIIITLKASAYINTKNSQISVIPNINGKEYSKWVFQNGRKTPKTEFLLKKSDLGKNSKVVISFTISGFKSPQEIGYGSDRKKLGLFLNSIELKPKYKI